MFASKATSNFCNMEMCRKNDQSFFFQPKAYVPDKKVQKFPESKYVMKKCKSHCVSLHDYPLKAPYSDT